MGTIVEMQGKKGVSYKAVVRMQGVTKTETFKKKALANDWIKKTEHAILHRAQTPGSNEKLGDLIRRYRTEIMEKRTYLTPKSVAHLKRFERQFANVCVADLTQEWWAQTASDWNVSPQSRTRYLTQLSVVLSAAQDLWGVAVDWEAYKRAKATLRRLKLTGKKKGREVRISDEILDLIKQAAAEVTSIPLADIIDFTIALGLRDAELCRIKHSDVDSKRRMMWVRDRKHPKEKIGNDTHIPLLGDSYEIIQRQKKKGVDRIFPFQPGTIGVVWKRACRKANVVVSGAGGTGHAMVATPEMMEEMQKDPDGFWKKHGLHFHDCRHEAISRLFESGYHIPEVVLVSGHHDWGSLKIYTNLKPESLHKGPASRRAA